MNELYKLRDMLCKELEEYGSKGEMSAGTLDVVDKLAHALKNLDKIIMYKDDGDGYSGRSYPYDGSFSRGRGYSARMSKGYSRHSGLAEDLRELMRDAPENIRPEIQRLADKIEQM